MLLKGEDDSQFFTGEEGVLFFEWQGMTENAAKYNWSLPCYPIRHRAQCHHLVAWPLNQGRFSTFAQLQTRLVEWHQILVCSLLLLYSILLSCYQNVLALEKSLLLSIVGKPQWLVVWIRAGCAFPILARGDSQITSHTISSETWDV